MSCNKIFETGKLGETKNLSMNYILLSVIIVNILRKRKHAVFQTTLVSYSYSN